MIRNRWWAGVITLGVAVLVGVLIMGCATDKGPAEAALAAAETAVNAAVAEASKYVPDQAKSLQAGLATVKEKFSKGDYAAATSEATALAAKAKDVASAAAAKKTELTQTWESMSAGMPKVVEAIKGRVDTLSQSKKLPANMTADKLATAKSGLGEITQQWTAATEAYKGGSLTDAITKGTAVKAKAAEVLTLLGMPVPEALKG
jgi:ribonuclease D